MSILVDKNTLSFLGRITKIVEEMDELDITKGIGGKSLNKLLTIFRMKTKCQYFWDTKRGYKKDTDDNLLI